MRNTSPIRVAALLAGLALCTAPLAAQQFINGDLENHTFAGCAYNNTNFAFSAGMVGCDGYGLRDEIDVMVGACAPYGPAGPVGQTSVGIACNAAPDNDAFTIELSAPLVPGQSYTLSFWGYSSINSFRPVPSPIRRSLAARLRTTPPTTPAAGCTTMSPAQRWIAAHSSATAI